MKNIIALSTILAAGTLCANAGTTIASSPTVTLDDYRYLISSWTQASNPSDLNSTSSVTVVSTALTQSWAVAFNLTPKNSSSTSSYTVLSTNNNSTGSYKFYYTPSTTTLAFNTSATGTSTFSLSNIDLTKAITIGFIKVSDGDSTNDPTGFFFAQNGTSYATTGLMSFSGTGYQLATTAAFWPNTDNNVAQISVSNITAYSSGLASATHIPEPSMFGLLAGTLALGLAGTRRRHRGNAK